MTAPLLAMLENITLFLIIISRILILETIYILFIVQMYCLGSPAFALRVYQNENRLI